MKRFVFIIRGPVAGISSESSLASEAELDQIRTWLKGLKSTYSDMLFQKFTGPQSYFSKSGKIENKIILSPGLSYFFIKQTMSARRCSIRQGSSTISTSSHTAGRAPLSDIRERLGNLRNTTAGRSNTSGKPSVDIWQKSVNATESAESLDVDALLARRARRKALRESTTRNISIEG